MKHGKLNLEWQVGYAATAKSVPEEFIPARVPGCAMQDWAEAHGYPDWKRDTNFTAWKWMEDVYWIYRARIPKRELAPGERLMLYCGGVDYAYSVRIGAKVVYEYEGMFRPFELDLTEGMTRMLTIAISPVPKDPTGKPDTRDEARKSAKPAACYGWDWHPRLVTSGIWGDTHIEIVSAPRIKSLEVLSELSEDLKLGTVWANYEIEGEGELDFVLYDGDGHRAAAWSNHQRGKTKYPYLWWCRGYGYPNLYTWKAALKDKSGEVIETRSGRVGFRTLKLCTNQGADEDALDFPKSAPLPSMTVVLNNVPVFCKGSNWVAPSPFPAEVTEEVCLPILERVRRMHMNMLRMWGGCIVNKDFFYDACDRLGILIWQEFPLSCNRYSEEREYLDVLEQEAEAIVTRLRHHPCLAFWCGGNELYNDWSGMTDQSLPLRALNAVCYRTDPTRPFIPTSPLPGAAHGPYLYRDKDGRTVMDLFTASRKTAYPEFGVPALSNLSTCLMACDRSLLEPLEENEITRAHHAFGAWIEGTWSCLDTLEHYFGPLSENVEENIRHSQFLQAQGLRFAFEEARRQKPYCSMALSWCLNEPWPTLANTSLISYPNEPKAACEALRPSLKPRTISARIRKTHWHYGEMFEAEIWILNDSRNEFYAGVVNSCLTYATVKIPLTTWFHPGIAPNQNQKGPTVRLPLDLNVPGKMELVLSGNKQFVRYPLVFIPDETKELDDPRLHEDVNPPKIIPATEDDLN